MSDAAAIQTNPQLPAVRMSVTLSLRRIMEYGALLTIWIGLLLLFGALSKNWQ